MHVGLVGAEAFSNSLSGAWVTRGGGIEGPIGK